MERTCHVLGVERRLGKSTQPSICFLSSFPPQPLGSSPSGSYLVSYALLSRPGVWVPPGPSGLCGPSLISPLVTTGASENIPLVSCHFVLVE